MIQYWIYNLESKYANILDDKKLASHTLFDIKENDRIFIYLKKKTNSGFYALCNATTNMKLNNKFKIFKNKLMHKYYFNIDSIYIFNENLLIESFINIIQEEIVGFKNKKSFQNKFSKKNLEFIKFPENKGRRLYNFFTNYNNDIDDVFSNNTIDSDTQKSKSKLKLKSKSKSKSKSKTKTKTKSKQNESDEEFDEETIESEQDSDKEYEQDSDEQDSDEQDSDEQDSEGEYVDEQDSDEQDSNEEEHNAEMNKIYKNIPVLITSEDQFPQNKKELISKIKLMENCKLYNNNSSDVELFKNKEKEKIKCKFIEIDENNINNDYDDFEEILEAYYSLKPIIKDYLTIYHVINHYIYSNSLFIVNKI